MKKDFVCQGEYSGIEKQGLAMRLGKKGN